MIKRCSTFSEGWCNQLIKYVEMAKSMDDFKYTSYSIQCSSRSQKLGLEDSAGMAWRRAQGRHEGRRAPPRVPRVARARSLLQLQKVQLLCAVFHHRHEPRVAARPGARLGGTRPTSACLATGAQLLRGLRKASAGYGKPA